MLKIKKILFSKTLVIVFSLVVSAGLVAGAFIYKTNGVYGYNTSDGGMRLFGGKISAIKLCCNGLKITIDKPLDGKFMFGGGSTLYAWYNLSQNQCVTGDAYPYGECIIITTWPPCDDEEDADGTIRNIGTTLSEPKQGTCEANSGGGGGGG